MRMIPFSFSHHFFFLRLLFCRTPCAYHHFALFDDRVEWQQMVSTVREKERKSLHGFDAFYFSLFSLPHFDTPIAAFHPLSNRMIYKKRNAIVCTATNARKYDFNIVLRALRRRKKKKDRVEHTHTTHALVSHPKHFARSRRVRRSSFIIYLFQSYSPDAYAVHQLFFSSSHPNTVNYVGFHFYCTRYANQSKE